MDKLILYIREEFEKIINETPQMPSSKMIIMSSFDLAWIKGMSRYAREKGIVLD